ncbi:MAG: tyrosine-protein phosphatase [Candidatus Eremiobacteraeota bacterium]|nr:tyrosine-protein phosphatase [Candidatus Eremiobacteraeota bacterium]
MIESLGIGSEKIDTPWTHYPPGLLEQEGQPGQESFNEPLDSVSFSDTLLKERAASPGETLHPARQFPTGAPEAGLETSSPAGEEPAKPISLPGLPNAGKLSEGLYRGAQPTKEGYKTLKDMGVKTVINFRTTAGEREKEAKELKKLGIGYVELPIEPGKRPTEEQMVQFLRTVKDGQNQPVYMHCKEGKDRTGVMAAVYRRVEEGWSADGAKKEMDNFGYHWFPYDLIGKYKDLVTHLDVEKLKEAAGN